MFGRLLDHPAQLLILLVIILLLFGASRLPNTARQLGRSMRIFKSEMKEMKNDDPRPAKATGDDETLRDDEASRIEALEGRIVDTTKSPATQPVPADTDRDN